MAATSGCSSARSATARAHPNIALVKYWGKRDKALNLPATGSLSITLDELATTTTVAFDTSLAADELWYGEAADPTDPSSAARVARVSAVLDLLRAQAGTQDRARVQTTFNFPESAGLASSASGFAALVVAADAALGLRLPTPQLSALARRGSGSAARSVIGGFAVMHPGYRDDGADAYAEQLLDPSDWPLHVVIAITSHERKSVGSTAGMERSQATSPYYGAWVDAAPADLEEARAAVARRDFDALAAISEHSCTKMHALMMSSRPALLYLSAPTVACLHRIRELRDAGSAAVFFTVDAGPQVKAVCLPADSGRVATALREIPGVLDVRTVGLGGPARVLSTAAGGPAPHPRSARAQGQP